MNRRGSYIGGSTVVYDPAYSARLARNLRKTRQSEKRRAFDRQRFIDELKAYQARHSVLIKRDENKT